VVPRLAAGDDVSALAARAIAAPRLLGRLEHVRPLYILSTLIGIEWLTILGVALTVRHNGWLYYQGGDQLWHYTSAWVMGQGRLSHTSVGYAWSIVLLPFALIGGPNLVSPLPFIVLLNVLVLMPIALLATYGIGRRMGGRLFGYWVALLWIVVPLIGIEYTVAGYHQRYTELLLPQSLGLTAMSDFPSLVVSIVAAYFAVRAVQDDSRWDGLYAGLFAGVALGIKPSNAPLVVGIVLALLWARRGRSLAYVAAGLSPGLLALALWKVIGEGKLPIINSGGPGAHAAPVLAVSLDIHRYIHPSWSFFSTQLHDLGQYFWSVRLLEWLAIAGTVGLLRHSRPIGLLFGGWFFTTIFVKWTSPGHGTVATSDLLRQSISTIPAALMILGGIVLLVPGLSRRLHSPGTEGWGTHRIRIGLAAALVVLFGVVPVALAAGLPVLKETDTISYYFQPGSLSAPFGVDKDWRPTVTRHGGRVRLTWPAQRPLGGTMDYVVFRASAKEPIYCDTTGGGAQCRLIGEPVIATRKTTFVDHVTGGAFEYRIAAVASWINDPTAGDIYVVSPPLSVSVPR
jgi:hypothetical protein